MKQANILVVGSINMDLIVYGVPKIPKFGESIACSRYNYATGGKGANQAYAAALQGANVSMVGRIGDDHNGHTIQTELNRVGIDTTFVVTDQESQTGIAPIMVDDEGKYFSLTVLGANNHLHADDVMKAIAANDYDMVLMQLEMPLETVYRTYEMAKENNIPVFLDAGPAMNIPLDRLKGIYIISPNEAETEALTGISIDSEEQALQAAQQLYERVTPTFVILKMGSRGAYVYDGAVGKMYPPFKVDAVDSTGAGDTFNASLAIKLCQGYPLETGIQFAQAAAAICVSRNGAQSSIPDTEEVEAFLQANNNSVNLN
ncbi:ribokinase [Bacillus sp. S3]|uniref:ribokinase n=1 Tax=Bacillus sp. S3 TaxID=486398 RepID=UPI00118AAB06|nr:ribokinase [Bacillus sp. S3]QCJ44494.1 ribokinase [Bacillus sp. S3]